MACKITPAIWVAIVATVATILVAENKSFCMALDLSSAKDSVVNTAEEAKNKAASLSSWALHKVSGKLSINPKDMKQGAEDMMHKAKDKASDAKEYANAKVHSVSHASTKKSDNTQKFYYKATNNVEKAYNSMIGKRFHKD